MDFLTAQKELSNRLGVYDYTISDDATKLKRWLNMAVQYICGKRLWPFLLASEIVQTVTDITTGTISINASATALTFSSAPTVSVQNRYIQFSTSDDWYQITSHTAASTSATISPAYVGTSNLTSGTYTVRKLLYSTSTPLIQIFDMKQLITPARLVSISPRTADFFLPLYYSAGTVYNYIKSVPDSTGAIQFSFVYSPSSIINVFVRGIKNLSDLSADGDSFIIPIPWQDAIINIAAVYGFQSVDDSRSADELAMGELRIKDMASIFSNDLGRHRVMQSIDTAAINPLQWALPSDFGPEVY